ncbi:aldehyde dehydrogenase family protein [bacterium]|nr:aldehyde dehydrogenase family protein [bacterium]
MAKRAKHNLIDGKWVKGRDVLPVTDPYTDEELGGLGLATAEQVEHALNAAEKAFHTTRTMPAFKRAALILNVRERIAADREKFARLLSREAGKPITLARGEIARSLETLLLAAEEARRIGGEYLPLDVQPGTETYQGFVRRVPRGPATALWPFNFPLNLLVHKIGPALACGCPVLMRPPSATPLTGHRVAEFLAEEMDSLGFPPGTAQFLGTTHHVAAPLIEDPRVKAVSFTGSDTVGWDIRRRAYKKQVMLELGGQASLIVEPDAPDLKFAAERAALGAFAYAGQVCISVQRVMVNKKVWDKWVPLFIAAVKRLKTGDPADDKVTVGPLIDDRADEKFDAWIGEAQAAGATKLCGTKKRKRLYTPHVLEHVKNTTQLHCGEAFGPVAVLEPYRDLDEAVRLTNNSRYGLQSAVFTANIDKALHAWREIEVGGLIVNDFPTFRVDIMPYGGVKDSGFGREGVRYAIEEYTEPRLMVVRGTG